MARKGKKLDLIQEPTTNKSDYKAWPLPRTETPPRPRPDDAGKDRRPTKIPQIDYQSHLQYTTDVPFDLYLEPKPIVGTSPHDPAPVSPPTRVLPLEKGRLTLKLPGKPVTDVEDEDIIRNVLINTYVPVHRGIWEDACLKVSAPALSHGVLVNDNVKFRPQLYPPLPPGWLEAAKHWDSLQSRVLGDPTRTFWLRRGPEVECFSKANYNDLMPEETKREIRALMQEDKLRLPYTVTKTGYRGYRQICAKGVPLRRNENFDF